MTATVTPVLKLSPLAEAWLMTRAYPSLNHTAQRPTRPAGPLWHYTFAFVTQTCPTPSNNLDQPSTSTGHWYLATVTPVLKLSPPILVESWFTTWASSLLTHQLGQLDLCDSLLVKRCLLVLHWNKPAQLPTTCVHDRWHLMVLQILNSAPWQILVRKSIK